MYDADVIYLKLLISWHSVLFDLSARGAYIKIQFIKQYPQKNDNAETIFFPSNLQIFINFHCTIKTTISLMLHLLQTLISKLPQNLFSNMLQN
jgi:hypothetical protein